LKIGEEDDFSQAYWRYAKKNHQSMAGKDPSLGVLTFFKQALVYNQILGLHTQAGEARLKTALLFSRSFDYTSTV